MLDHIILTVSDVERSLKFYTAALKLLKIHPALSGCASFFNVGALQYLFACTNVEFGPDCLG